MGRWVAVTEGSSSWEVPLSLPSPKPPPQVSLLLHPPLLQGQSRASSPLTKPHLTPGGFGVGAPFWHPSSDSGRPPSRAPVPSEGRRTQNGGLLFRRSAACGETLRTQVLSWHFVDTARPPDGVRGPLGGQPRPRPSPRPNLNEAPPFGVAPPLSPPPAHHWRGA